MQSETTSSNQGISNQWWMPKEVRRSSESQVQENKAQKKVDVVAAETVPTFVNRSSAASSKNKKEGAFLVPNWFGSTPQPYTRPVEIFRAPSLGQASFSSSIIPSLALSGLPWGLSSLARAPYLGPCGAVAPGAFLRLGNSGFGDGVPFAWGAPYLSGGLYNYGYGRPFLGLGFGDPGFGAWGFGPFGNAGGYWPGALPFGGLGLVGFGQGSGLGSLRSTGEFATRVFQTQPSKSSGNYYEPSSADTTASGSYYASSSPAIMPAIPVKQSPDSYWDESSNPIPKNLR